MGIKTPMGAGGARHEIGSITWLLNQISFSRGREGIATLSTLPEMRMRVVLTSKERLEIGTGLYVSRQAALAIATAVGRESSDSERGVLRDVVRFIRDKIFYYEHTKIGVGVLFVFFYVKVCASNSILRQEKERRTSRD
jgi:hypothetical protein